MRNLLEKPSATKHLDVIKRAPSRTLIGIAIIVVSSVLGGALLQRDHAEQRVWQLRHDVAVGEVITEADVRQVRIPANFNDVEWLQEVSPNLHLTHTLRAGVLLTRDDATNVAEPCETIALVLPSGEFPLKASIGSVVTLWQIGLPRPLTTDAVVVDLDRDSDPGRISVQVRVTPDEAPILINASENLRVSVRG